MRAKDSQSVFLILVYKPSPISINMPAPLPPPLSSLRLGTFNVGLGFPRKLPSILSRSTALSLDIVALQEIADPALFSNKLFQYSLVYSGGPSQHEAGVGLLLSHELSPFCRTYRRSASGRLVGAVLELERGQRLLVVSAYMPSGLDHRSDADQATINAHQLYSEIIDWTRDMHQVIVLGDLNETLTAHDRFPLPAPRRAAATPSPIQCLEREGFSDVYRLLHPDSARHPGFTHAINSVARIIRSRIDYIWTRGFGAASVLQVQVDVKLQTQRLSAHRLLWTELQLSTTLPPPTSTPLYHAALPNVRAASQQRRSNFAAKVKHALQSAEAGAILPALAMRDDPASLSSLASLLTCIVHDAAFASLPLVGAAPSRSKSILRLKAQRRSITRLLHLSDRLVLQGISFVSCPAWLQLYHHCEQQHNTRWTVDASSPANTGSWLAETRRFLAQTRSEIQHAARQLGKARRPPLDASPAAAVHRMLDSDALPSQLFSVVDSHGQLTTTPDELKRTMVDHFTSVFEIPPAPAIPLDPPPPPCLFDKPGIDPAWYVGLMASVDAEELLALLQHIPIVSAPGEDKVSAAVWRLGLQEVDSLRHHVLHLFNCCLRTSTFPAAWKTGVILPFVKDSQKERTMRNIRPITLQSCLGKLFNKLLAHRLGAICARHPILHPAQRGFVVGGTTVKCLDELLDAWDWSRCSNRQLYTLFYDIKQAYDSVQVDVFFFFLNS